MKKGRKRPYGAPHPELDLERAMGGVRRESRAGGQSFTVRTVTAEKTYTCPGCNGTIQVGVRHVVAWSEDHLFGADAALAERRHWHSGCWNQARRRGW
ncbi:MAG TPA: hypothetical protein GX743_02625 [Actinomycetales bacterium]|nr:hypothetical protein [Actinomycetales bacterium]